MTEDRRDSRRGPSRRSVLRTGALASGALALGPSSIAAQDGNATGGNATGGNRTGGNRTDGTGRGGRPIFEALLFNDEFRPGAQFRVISGVVSETPTLDTGAQEILGQYDAYIIEYLNTDERVLLFVDRSATVEEGEVYRFQPGFRVVAPEPSGEGVISVRFEPVADDDVLAGPEGIGGYETIQGGGKALVRADNLHAGALIQVVSGIVEWTPPPDVAGADLISEYNTRHAVYLNTDDELLIYPAEEAEIAEGEVYVIREEFDVTDPEGNLVTVELLHVNRDSLDEDLLQ